MNKFPTVVSIALLSLISAGVASAQTYNKSIAAGSGTLNYTVLYEAGTERYCTGDGGYSYINKSFYSSFSYTAAGVTSPLTGKEATALQQSVCGVGVTETDSPVTLVGPGLEIVFTPSMPTGGSAILTSGTLGFINPKYVVVGVTYAPPGPSSYFQYTGATTIGNTSTVSSSFSDDVGFSISVTNMAGIPSTSVTPSGSVTLTYTNSYDYTVGQNTSTTVTISKTSSVSYKTAGVPTAFTPVDHDYDYIWLWLNPELLFSVIPTTPSTLQWNGYAYDSTDPSGTGGPDIYAVQVGCLNGHFSCPSAKTILARSWATDVTWPSGQGPGLTSADISNILLSDPLSSTAYNELASLPSTSSDGRFSQGPYPPNPLNYTVGGLNTQYSISQTDTESVASGSSYQIKEAFGLSEKLSGKFLGIWGTSTTYTETNTLIWNYSYLNTLTTTRTITDALSVTGPPDPPPTYSGPGEFIVYQDNLFGTFLCYPSN